MIYVLNKIKTGFRKCVISKYLTIYVCVCVCGWVCVGCDFDNFICVVPVSIGGSASANAKDVFYLTTRSQPLKPLITGGSEQFIGVDQVFLLDASSSVDPDRSDEETYYTWKCQVLAAFVVSFFVTSSAIL